LAEHHVARALSELEAGLSNLLAQPEQGFVLLALSSGELIGVAFCTRILSLEHGGWSAWLDELYVLPQERGRGVGSSLLAAAISGAKARGWAALDLEVDTDHRRVIPLYQRHDFQSVSRTRFVRRLR
jgi:GNAT superfamily N-acetyltransferase